MELCKGNQCVGARREGLVRTKECNQVKGTYLWRPQRKGYVEIQEECEHVRGTYELGPADRQDREGVRPSEWHSPLEAAEGGYISTQKKQPHEGHSRVGDSKTREGMPNALVW